MINHARTLLLNRVGPRGPGFGEEYIPAEFRPLAWPGYAMALRQVLYGATPDRTMEAYRTRMLMQLLHASELEQFVLALDPRIAYDIDRTRYLAGFEPQISNWDSANLHLVGTLAAPDVTGICDHAWTVEVLDESRVRVRRTVAPGADVTLDYDDVDGLSSLCALPESTLQFRFQTGLPGCWTIAAQARPTDGLEQLTARLQALSGQVFTDLFGVGTQRANQEPFQTFRQLWETHPELPYRLGGLLLALIYRLEELRSA